MLSQRVKAARPLRELRAATRTRNHKLKPTYTLRLHFFPDSANLVRIATGKRFKSLNCLLVAHSRHSCDPAYCSTPIAQQGLGCLLFEMHMVLCWTGAVPWLLSLKGDKHAQFLGMKLILTRVYTPNTPNSQRASKRLRFLCK